jgi:hypothetical protein
MIIDMSTVGAKPPRKRACALDGDPAVAGPAARDEARQLVGASEELLLQIGRNAACVDRRDRRLDNSPREPLGLARPSLLDELGDPIGVSGGSPSEVGRQARLAVGAAAAGDEEEENGAARYR